MTKLSYDEWSKQNPIDWDKIENAGSEDCLITKPFVEFAHRFEYQIYCREMVVDARAILDVADELEAL